MYINVHTVPQVIQLANDTVGKMCNKYVELYLAGGAYEYLEQQIVLVSSYIDATSNNYEELADTSDVYQEMINNLYNLVSLQEYTPYQYGEPVDATFVYTANQRSNIYDGFTSVTSYTPNRFIISNEYGYPIASQLSPSEALVVPPLKIPFEDEASPSITSYQTNYAGTYGNFPSVTLFLDQGSHAFAPDQGASPTFQYDATDSLLQSITYSLGFAQTGYILLAP